jgi:hypothetical protein
MFPTWRRNEITSRLSELHICLGHFRFQAETCSLVGMPFCPPEMLFEFIKRLCGESRPVYSTVTTHV